LNQAPYNIKNTYFCHKTDGKGFLYVFGRKDKINLPLSVILWPKRVKYPEAQPDGYVFSWEGVAT